MWWIRNSFSGTWWFGVYTSAALLFCRKWILINAGNNRQVWRFSDIIIINGRVRDVMHCRRAVCRLMLSYFPLVLYRKLTKWHFMLMTPWRFGASERRVLLLVARKSSKLVISSEKRGLLILTSSVTTSILKASVQMRHRLLLTSVCSCVGTWRIEKRSVWFVGVVGLLGPEV